MNMPTATTSARRSYRQGARADAVARTHDAIIRAAVAAFWDSPTADVRLDDVASRAGVTVQTVLRHFGSKGALSAAAVAWQTAQVASSRDPARVDGVASAVRQLVDHYEEVGDGVVRLLAAEARTPELREIAEGGRAFHREWCRAVFAHTLAALPPAERRVRLAVFVAICDVFTWRLLRRQEVLGRRATETALLQMLQPLLLKEDTCQSS